MSKVKISMKFPNDIYQNLKTHLLKDRNENMAYLFGNSATSDTSYTFYPQKLILFNSGELERSPSHAVLPELLAHEVYCQFCDGEYDTIINCHSHPFDEGEVAFSNTDNKSGKREGNLIFTEVSKLKNKSNTNPPLYYGAMVFGQNTVAARMFDNAHKNFQSVDSIIVIGEPVQYIQPTNTNNHFWFSKREWQDYGKIQERQVLAFGKQGQEVISKLEVVVVGLGGIGSIVIEGLGRLGVRNIVLIDFDHVEHSNLNRLQGAQVSDTGKPKIEVFSRNLKSYFPKMNITCLQKSLFDNEVLEKIKHSDCLIGCLDNHESRFFLNRISLQYMIPYIDGATVILSSDGKITDIDMSASVVLPSISRCLDCSQVIHYDKQKVHQFFIDKTTRENLVENGYIKDDSVEVESPSVYPLNLSVSGFMLFEFLNLFTGYKQVHWHSYLNHMNLVEKQDHNHGTQFLGLHSHYEPPSGRCLNCEDYKALGDSVSLSNFTDLNQEILFPNV